jgi:hypothetical protein
MFFFVRLIKNSRGDTAHTPKGRNDNYGEWNPRLFKIENKDKQKTSFDELIRFR